MYKRILVPIDGSETSLCALSEAAKLANLCGAQVDVLHIVEAISDGFEPPEVYLRDILPRLIRHGAQLLQDHANGLRAQGVTTDTVLIEGGVERVSDMIIEQAQTRGADLIVLGTHGRHGFNRLMMGSDAEEVARKSTVPVMLVRAPAPAEEPRSAAA